MASQLDRRFGTARDVNPDAGTHAVSTHPEERAAAEAATRQSWREFPYYARRFGERGWRFSLSDSGWLTTLSEASDTEAIGQTDWLARLLAARGMPRYLLERHLLQLHSELMRRAPQMSSQYQVLMQCAASLTSSRLAVLDGASFRELAREFEDRAAGFTDRIPNFGLVLVAAIADAAAGLAQADDNVLAWATDPSRFSEGWIAAVRDTAATTRLRISGKA